MSITFMSLPHSSVKEYHKIEKVKMILNKKKHAKW